MRNGLRDVFVTSQLDSSETTRTDSSKKEGRARTDSVQDALGEEGIVIAGGEEHRAADRPQLVEGDAGVEAAGGRFLSRGKPDPHKQTNKLGPQLSSVADLHSMKK